MIIFLKFIKNKALEIEIKLKSIRNQVKSNICKLIILQKYGEVTNPNIKIIHPKMCLFLTSKEFLGFYVNLSDN